MKAGSNTGPRTHCIRCGTCCTKGGPTLHEEDAILFTEGVLDKRHVYTLRKGEVVRDLNETLVVLRQEMIKIKGTGETWACIFYDTEKNACKIYEQRPRECRAMKCWDLRQLKEVIASPCLQRRHLIGADNGLVKLMDAHETRCSYALLDSAVRELKGSNAAGAVARILDILRYDYDMRPFLAEKLRIDPGVMDFLFGRPLTVTIRMFGLRIKQEGDTFTLLPMNGNVLRE